MSIFRYGFIIGCFLILYIAQLIIISKINSFNTEITDTVVELERCQVELKVYKSEMDLTLREPIEIIKIGEN